MDKKKIIAIIVAAVVAVAAIVGTIVGVVLSKKDDDTTSSKKPTSSQADDDVIDDVSSSAMAENESGDGSSYHPYDWELKTKSAFFRDTEEATEAVTVSKSVKVYKNRHSKEIGVYHFGPARCKANGTDYEAQIAEYEDVVKQGYFNTFFVDADPSNKFFEDQCRIVAENGGTIWCGASKSVRFGKNTTVEEYTAKIAAELERFKSVGCLDLVNGYHWDEPIMGGESNKDFEIQSKIFYKTFGLRTFPVFATGEFSNAEGNELNGIESADKIGKLLPSAGKYITDIAYDSYSVDVREDKVRPGQSHRYKYWSESIGDKTGKRIQSGKDYYIELRKYLCEYVKHDVNFWYFPTSYNCGSWSGVPVDEDFWLAQLRVMVDDVMKNKNGAGVMLYTFAKWSDDTAKDYGLEWHLDIKNPDGSYKYYPDSPDYPVPAPKYHKYCNELRKICKQFNNTKFTSVKLKV